MSAEKQSSVKDGNEGGGKAWRWDEYKDGTRVGDGRDKISRFNRCCHLNIDEIIISGVGLLLDKDRGKVISKFVETELRLKNELIYIRAIHDFGDGAFNKKWVMHNIKYFILNGKIEKGRDGHGIRRDHTYIGIGFYKNGDQVLDDSHVEKVCVLLYIYIYN